MHSTTQMRRVAIPAVRTIERTVFISPELGETDSVIRDASRGLTRLQSSFAHGGGVESEEDGVEPVDVPSLIETLQAEYAAAVERVQFIAEQLAILGIDVQTGLPGAPANVSKQPQTEEEEDEVEFG